MEFHPSNYICGLHYIIAKTRERVYLPQVQLTSHTTINPVCFTTKLTQTFQNSQATALSQVRYTFPLYDGVAVNGYTISYDSKILKGVVKQKDVAKKTYQEAVDRGQTAGLLEALPAGVFGVTLGNVPAKTDILVEITYCGELKHDAAIDGLRYMLPTSIAPRYGSYPGKVLDYNTVAKGGMKVTVDVDMATSAIRKVQSPSHPIAVSMGAISTADSGNQAPFVPSQASATLTLGTAQLADDFVLQLLIDDINKPQAILETHPTIPNQRAIMSTLVPRFALDPIYPEIVFIADQSGSMGGSKNDALVSALKVFLKSLPVGVRFNICAFGNHFKFLWPQSQAYNEANLNTAMSFVNTFTASYGGTEILKPITAAFEQRLSDLPFEVMLLTDGEIWGEDAVFSYINEQIRDKGADARVFALGIGGDVSHTLVEGVGRAGNGFAQFVTQNEETDQKVIRMLKGALYAHTKDYELEVHYEEKDKDEISDDDDFEIVEKVHDCLKIEDKPADPAKQSKSDSGKATLFFDKSIDVDQSIKGADAKGDRYSHLPPIETPKIVQAPSTIPPLFPFNRSTMYLLLGPDSAQKKVTSVTLRATSAQGPLELNLPVHITSTPKSSTIHQLAARKAIQDLEEGRGWIQAAKTVDGASIKTKYKSRFDELLERECVTLGEKFQVAGKWTSFVAVGDDQGNEHPEDDPQMSDPEVSDEDAGFGLFDGGGLFGSAAAQPRKRMATSSASAMPPPPSGSRYSAGYQEQPCKRTQFNRIQTPDANDPSSSVGFGQFASFSKPASFRSAAPQAPMQASAASFGSAPLGPASFGSGGLFGSAPSPIQTQQAAPQQMAVQMQSAPALDASLGSKSMALNFGADEGASVDAQKQSEERRHSARSLFGASAPRSSVGGQPPRKQLASVAARAAAPMSSAASGNSDVQKMHTLVSLQTFSGAWAWSTELFSTLGVSETTIKVDGLRGSRDICATVLAVAYLETKVSSQKAVWEMVVSKARGWLATQMGTDAAGVDTLVSRASGYL